MKKQTRDPYRFLLSRWIYEFGQSFVQFHLSNLETDARVSLWFQFLSAAKLAAVVEDAFWMISISPFGTPS